MTRVQGLGLQWAWRRYISEAFLGSPDYTVMSKATIRMVEPKLALASTAALEHSSQAYIALNRKPYYMSGKYQPPPTANSETSALNYTLSPATYV